MSLPPLSPSPLPAAPQPTPQTFHIGARASTLSQHQVSIVHRALLAHHPQHTYTTHSVSVLGDRDKTTPLPSFNAKSLWTHDLETQLLSGALDLIVHSLKDMPTQLPRGCTIGAILARTDPRDCVVMSERGVAAGKRGLGDLEKGEVVGTSSVRRAAQIRRRYPGLEVRDLRGNVPTRIRKVDEEALGFSCAVVAAAGVERLGMGERITGYLSGGEGGMLHAVGQGAIGVEVREGDKRVEGLLRGVGEERVWRECVAERSLLRALEGGCSVPIGVETEWEGGDMLVLRAVVVSVDGREAVEGERRMVVGSLEEAEELGLQVAENLVSKGAGKILEKITLNREIIEGQDGA